MSELVERLESYADALPWGNDSEVTANLLREAAAALSRAGETEAAWERSRDLVTEQYRVVANALSRTEAQRDDLLCRIHRDGGDYLQEHGIDKACADADEIVAAAFAQRDALAKALIQIRDHWHVNGDDPEAARRQQDMRASASMRDIATRALAQEKQTP